MEKCCYNIPKFASNTILRSVDLNAVNNNLFNASFLEFEEYEDGVISGLDTYTDGLKIFVKKGIYKYKGQVMFLDTDLSIMIPNNEGEYVLYLKNKTEDQEYVVSKISYLKFSNNKDNENGIELSRFHIREGAKLENENYTLKKFEKEYNVLNSLEVKFSKTGINPKILKMWSNQMLEKKLNSLDILVVYLCNLGLVNIEILKDYITKKLDINIFDCSNKDILSFLYNILENQNTSLSLDSLEENIKNISVE